MQNDFTEKRYQNITTFICKINITFLLDCARKKVATLPIDLLRPPESI